MRGLPQKQNARRADKIRLCGHLGRYKKIVKKTYIILYNYIGICIGSICIFLLVRKYGHRIILKLCKKKDYDKYLKYTYDQNKFDTFFMLAIFLPCAPDDLLCMLAGLTHMSLKKFVWIILLGKPLSLMAYSYGLTQLFQIIERWL